jgi:large subunit ribosomal protein L18
MAKTKEARRAKIRKGIRGKITGISTRPRLSVFRSNKDIFAQRHPEIKKLLLIK